MTHIAFSAHSSGRSARTRVRHSIAARLVGRIKSEWRVHRDRRILETMSDAGLQDIGISRSEIGYAVRNGRP
jgi:uncharacterized protein YjiS (DUF1127 family)